MFGLAGASIIAPPETPPQQKLQRKTSTADLKTDETLSRLMLERSPSGPGDETLSRLMLERSPSSPAPIATLDVGGPLGGSKDGAKFAAEDVPARKPNHRKPLSINNKVRLVGDLVEDASPTRCDSLPHPAQAAQTPGHVVSVWGRHSTDADSYMPFFAQKPMHVGGELSNIAHCIGVLSHRGQKKECPNQDDFFVLSRKESLFFGVLDGHGPEGEEVAHFAQELLPLCLVKELRKDRENWKEAAHAAFRELTEKVRSDVPAAELSGSTCSVVMIDRAAGARRGPLRLRCAHLGDSIVVHATRPANKKEWAWTQLTDIHRPDRDDEATRIISAGGKVVASAGPGLGARLVMKEWTLGMSRSIGDFHAEPFGLSSVPELSEEVALHEANEHFVLACSDGVWDVLPPGQAVKFVGKFKPSEAQLAVERLVSKAQRRWQEMGDAVDDITAILVWCSFDGEEDEGSGAGSEG